MKKKKVGIMSELLALIVIPMLLLEVIITSLSINAMSSMVKRQALDGLHLLCTSVYAAYEAKDSGDLILDGERLFKGSYCISEHQNVVDSFVEGSDADVTLFYGDTRRATSLRDINTGSRILGTKAADEVIEQVLKQGNTYETSDVTINGQSYYAVYEPIYNSDGSIAGMVFAGEPSTEVTSTITQKTISIISVSAVVWIVALIAAFLIAKRIAAAIIQTQKLLESLSEGNLQLEVPAGILARNDEIGVMAHSMGTLLTQLNHIMGGIKKNTDTLMQQGDSLESMASQTSATADEISSAVEDISKGAVSMAEDIESATGQINNMGIIIEKIVESIQELDRLSGNMHSADTASAQIINELSESNDKTTEAIKKIEESVRTTNESVTRIQEAVNLISSIASETSLLALNASIEAARAGEAGRGFAVVATQISKLSEDSNQSAKTIEDIIHQLAIDSEASVKIMNEVDAIVTEQQKKLNETKEKFSDVSNGIEDSMKETQVINGQATECDSNRAVVVDVISSLSAVSQENAASTEETTASMEELNATINLLAQAAKDLKDIAESLEKDVAFFQL
ncbi:MAG: methyl-accepting chemotaxis protein [Lachnospiraceae bacterium]